MKQMDCLSGMQMDIIVTIPAKIMLSWMAIGLKFIQGHPEMVISIRLMNMVLRTI